MHFLSQADNLLVSTQAQKCKFMFKMFPWCDCSCCMFVGPKKAEKAQSGWSVSYRDKKRSGKTARRCCPPSDILCGVRRRSLCLCICHLPSSTLSLHSRPNISFHFFLRRGRVASGQTGTSTRHSCWLGERRTTLLLATSAAVRFLPLRSASLLFSPLLSSPRCPPLLTLTLSLFLPALLLNSAPILSARVLRLSQCFVCNELPCRS